MLAASLWGVGSLHAQTTNPLIAETKGAYNSIKDYLTRAAAAMPEANYGFQPTPDIRTFGALLGHIADHQMLYCSTALGARQEMVGQRSKLGTLILDVVHSNEEYGYMAIYFRLKGIVPPSTDKSAGK
jgi:hypothetical protein